MDARMTTCVIKDASFQLRTECSITKSSFSIERCAGAAEASHIHLHESKLEPFPHNLRSARADLLAFGSKSSSASLRSSDSLWLLNFEVS
jgi:hypothetical protein